MEGGLLSLKWNNHRSTFLHVLSTVRHKESYCDVTIACDGKFYPVHKLVLSTCSEYFEQMFERTNCKHPIIVLKDIRKDDLEALLNYMYVGEVNVLQNNLSGLIKAAEGLRIKGLAVPDESPSENETAQEGKRSLAWGGEVPDAKRRRPEETSPIPQRPIAAPTEKAIRERSPVGYRETFRNPSRSRDPLSPASITPSPETHPPAPAPPTIDPAPDLSNPPPPSLDLAAGATHTSACVDSSSNIEAVRQTEHELKLDEALVKEEPHDNYSEPDESKEGLGCDSDGGGSSLNYSHHPPTSSLEVGAGPGRFSPGMRAATQPQTLEDLVSLPGASGLQGKPLWEGDRALLGIPFESYSNQPRASQMEAGGMVGVPNALGDRFTCSYCCKTFNHKNNFRKHIRTHTGERPYLCPHCSYCAARTDLLRVHILKKHTYQSHQFTKA